MLIKSFIRIKDGDETDKRFSYLPLESKRLSILSPALILIKDLMNADQPL